jgi:hypothetical protein
MLHTYQFMWFWVLLGTAIVEKRANGHPPSHLSFVNVDVIVDAIGTSEDPTVVMNLSSTTLR